MSAPATGTVTETSVSAADLATLVGAGTRWPMVSREEEHRALAAADRVATATGQHPGAIWQAFVAPRI